MSASRDRWDKDDPHPVLSLRPRWRQYVGPALVLVVLVSLLFGATWSLRRPPSPAFQSVPAAEATARAVLPAPAAKFPVNGYTIVNLKRGVARDGSLTFQTAGVHAGAHWVIVIRRWSDAAWVATVYLDASSVMTIFLPAGDYEISAANGEVWRGEHALFGEATRALRLRKPVHLAPTGAGEPRQALLFPPGNATVEGIPVLAFQTR